MRIGDLEEWPMRRVYASAMPRTPGPALIHPEVHQLYGDDRAVALAEDPRAGAVLPIAVPHDDEVSSGVGRDGRPVLGVRRVGVDAELGAERRAVARVALAEKVARGAPVTPAAGPGDDEVAGGVGGHGRRVLIARGVGVHAELRAQRDPRARKALPEDSEIRSILGLAVPDDDEVP